MFRLIFRLLGWFLLLAAVLILAYDAYIWYATGALELTAAGELWFRLDAASLNLLQAVIERYVWEPLWNPGIVTVLLWPAVAVLGVPGLVLILLTWRRG